jgi:hypothetical protein
MKKEVIFKGVKAAAGLLSLVGVLITPDQVEAISAGFVAVYSIASGIEAMIKHKE